MANKSIIAAFVFILVIISLIISIPLLTLSSTFSNYGTINEPLFFDFSSPIEKLNVNIDWGDIEIKYVTTPVDYYVKIQVDIELIGQSLAEKEYSDFFSVDWDDTSPSPTFTMLCKSDACLDLSRLLKQDVDIIITLNAIILFDINITVNKKGNVHQIVPFGVTTDNIDIYTNEGDIFCDFNYCTLEGNITGIANDGNIGLKAYNPEYTRNITWACNSIAGNIRINISHINQYKIMNATITGSLVGNFFGDIYVYYYDNTANIGARITLNDTIAALKGGRYRSDWEGFEVEVLKNSTDDQYGYELTSTDFPAITNYNLLLKGLTLYNYEGKYEVYLYSY